MWIWWAMVRRECLSTFSLFSNDCFFFFTYLFERFCILQFLWCFKDIRDTVLEHTHTHKGQKKKMLTNDNFPNFVQKKSQSLSGVQGLWHLGLKIIKKKLKKKERWENKNSLGSCSWKLTRKFFDLVTFMMPPPIGQSCLQKCLSVV